MDDNSTEAIRSLREEYRALDADDEDRAPIMARIGLLHARRGETRQAIRAFAQSLDDARTSNNTETAARSLESLGLLHARMGDYPAALEHYHECIRLQQNNPDPVITGTTWMEIGSIYGEMGNLESALDAFERSASTFRAGGHHFLEVRTLVNIANVRVAAGELRLALEAMLRALIIFEGLGEQESRAEALVTIGTIHERMHGAEAGLQHYDHALEIARTLEIAHLVARASLGRATALGSMDRADEGLMAVDEGLVAIDEATEPDIARSLHETGANLSAHLQNYRAAYTHLKSVVALSEAITNRNRERTLMELQVRFDVEQATTERNLYRNRAEDLRREVTDKNMELTSLALSLVQKNEFLDDLKLQLQDMMQSSEARTLGMAGPLIEEIKASRDEDGWQLFERQFEQVHQEYLKNLAERFPSLTPMEMKICALTRADLATKEIARLLYLSVRNIQNHRYRIRKKLGLSSEEHLETYLASL